MSLTEPSLTVGLLPHLQKQASRLDAVSTTCGSGWVNHSYPKSLAISHSDHYPPATAGGTDRIQGEFPGF